MIPCPPKTSKVWVLSCHRQKTREFWQYQILIQKIDKTDKSTQLGLRAVYPSYSTQYSAFLPIRAKKYSRFWQWTLQCDSDGISTGLYGTSQGVSILELKPAFQQKLNINAHFIRGFRLVYSNDPSDQNAQGFFVISITVMLCGGFPSHPQNPGSCTQKYFQRIPFWQQGE